MSENYGYPLSDEEVSHSSSSTTEYNKDTYHEFDFTEFDFEVSGDDFTFRPMFYPERVVVGKQRDLVREKGICRNEYVKDVGTENREIHIVGYVSAYRDENLASDIVGEGETYQNNLQSFHDMVDFGQRADLITMQWQGEVVLEDSDLEGPEGIDPQTGHFLYEYDLNFVSTGRDEMGSSTTGIVSEGTASDSSWSNYERPDRARGADGMTD